MIKIFSNIIPFKGFTAIAIWPFVFVRKGSWYFNTTNRHEKIHGEQQKEMLLLLFYLWYGVEWFIKWAYYRNRTTAYKNVSFEREAYANQSNITYLDERKPYAFLKYLTKNN